MDSARWERIQSVFHQIADLPAAERSAALDHLCGEEGAIRAEVLSLLEEETTGESLLDRGTREDRLSGDDHAPSE